LLLTFQIFMKVVDKIASRTFQRALTTTLLLAADADSTRAKFAAGLGEFVAI
jgi:hypothetical protein